MEISHSRQRLNAAREKLDAKDLAGAVQPGAPMFGIESAFSDSVVFVGGAVPVTDPTGQLIGAVGVGGGYPDQDHEVAEAVKHAL